MWTQIPGYQGFKPAELTFKEYERKIGERGNVNKGDLKLQTTQNFLVHPPGYGGFKPKFQNTMSQIRTTCLGNTSQI